MPNRILRDWTDSDAVNNLTPFAERFFTRLIMKVDDYGRYPNNVKLMKSLLFPIREDIRITDIKAWLDECINNDLVLSYNVNNENFIQIIDFRQHKRTMKSKYPSPDQGEKNNNPSNIARRPLLNEVSNGKKEINTELMPSLDEFMRYAEEKSRHEFANLKQGFELTYSEWKDSSWKDGQGFQITPENWKGKLIRRIPYLREIAGKPGNEKTIRVKGA